MKKRSGLRMRRVIGIPRQYEVKFIHGESSPRERDQNSHFLRWTWKYGVMGVSQGAVAVTEWNDNERVESLVGDLNLDQDALKPLV